MLIKCITQLAAICLCRAILMNPSTSSSEHPLILDLDLAISL